MKKYICHFLGVLVTIMLNSCAAELVDNIKLDSNSRTVYMPYISGIGYFTLNSEQEYTLYDPPIGYTTRWDVLNATIVSQNNKSVIIKFDKDVSVVHLSADVRDLNEPFAYNPRFEIKRHIPPAAYIILGPTSIGEGESWTYKLDGQLNKDNYKNVEWSTSDNALSILKVTSGQMPSGEYYNQIEVKRNFTNKSICTLYAKILKDGSMKTYSRAIELQKINTIDDIDINASQGFNDAQVKLLNLPSDATISWEVIGDGYRISFQGKDFINLSINNEYSESTVIATVHSNGKTKQFTKFFKPQLNINVKLIFRYIGYNNGGAGDVTISKDYGDDYIYKELESNGMESVQYFTLTPGKYSIEGRGTPLNNLLDSFEIIRSDFSDYTNQLLININIDENNWHMMISKEHQ